MHIQGKEHIWLSALKIEGATQPSETNVVYVCVCVYMYLYSEKAS